jgi:rSAM/selenodomain-associated transferase 2
MRAPISVIVPTLDAGIGLHNTLSCLMDALEIGLIREVIVSDAGSMDQTLEIAKDWGAKVVSGVPSRGGQLRRGCEAAKGEWFLVLHADTVLSDDWVNAAVRHLQTSDAGWFDLQFDGGGVKGWLVSLWANMRSRIGLPYGDQGLLVSRTLYEAVGGYRDIPLMEDVALVRALRGKLRRINATAKTSAVKYQTQGWIKRGVCNMITLLQYFSGTDPEELAARYRR